MIEDAGRAGGDPVAQTFLDRRVAGERSPSKAQVASSAAEEQ